jgi:hypothetical protein
MRCTTSRHAADRRAALIAGSAVGVAILFRHDLGGLCADRLPRLLRARPRRDGRRSRDRSARLAFRFGAAVLGVLGRSRLRCSGRAAARSLRQLVRIPIVRLPAGAACPFRRLPLRRNELVQQRSFSALGLLVVYLPLAATAVAIASETMRGRAEPAGTATSATASTLQLLLLLNVLFFAKGLVRVSPLHMGAVAGRLGDPGRGDRSARPPRAVAPSLLVIGALACAGLVAKPFVSAGERSAHSGASASEALLSDRWISQAAALCNDASLPRLQCLRLDRDRTTVARYLLEHGGRGQRVYIGAGRHDRLLVNDVTLYFAAEAIAPTRWHDLHPGVQTTRETQAEMIAEFEARPLAFVVLNTEWDDRQEPNDSARSSGVTLLDDWLRDRFRPVLKPAH